MIPYEIIVTSAARPRLLQPTLESLLPKLDQDPERLLIHDDAAFTEAEVVGVTPDGPVRVDHRWEETKEAIRLAMAGREIPVLLTHADPPRRLGLALRWLLANVQTEYVLYSQDDFVTVRDLPIQRALAVMNHHSVHQIRFNKRATLGQKDTWQGVWRKKEVRFDAMRLDSWANPVDGTILTVADHWYFQTGLWRTAVIRAAVDWCTATPERTALFAACPAEEAINKAMDGDFGPIPGLTVPYPDDALDPLVRARVQRTFIWGPIGEDRYIRHIGTDPRDWSGTHPRGEQERVAWEAKNRQAWDEIASYRSYRKP